MCAPAVDEACSDSGMPPVGDFAVEMNVTSPGVARGETENSDVRAAEITPRE